MFYNLNGKIVEGSEVSVSLHNRGLNYGDGIFESMKFANGRINFWEDHYFRLMASMRIVRMEIPMSFSPEFLENEIRKTISENGLDGKAVRVKFITFRKPGGLYTPYTNKVDYLITVSELDEATYSLNEKGLDVDLFRDYYKQKSLLSTVKSTSCMLYTVASIFRNENDLDECLLLNDDKMVTEAISSNVFLVKEKKVTTPPLSDGCLKGVMRKNVLEVLPKMGYEVEEKSFSPFEIQKADELFLTNALKGIRWVERYRKKSFTNKCANELVKKLNVAVAIGS